MPTVRVAAGALWVDDLRVPLLAGEVHYWRLNPARWPAVLDGVRRLGLDIVATYVPWEYHELAPGRFDFHGRTEPPRNLVGFLDLLQQRGFWIFIRPGPFIYAEWAGAGVPERVVGLPRLSAAYRREARAWMEAVSAVLRPYLATAGGRILLFQPDNEMDLFSHWFEDECGLSGSRPGFFQEFLREAYPDVAALNAAWGTAHASFEQAQPLAVRLSPADPGLLARHRDYWRFQHWATAAGVRWHAETYRALGIDVPQVANYYPGGDVQNWRAVARTVDLVGIDWYPRNEFGGDSAEHRRFLDTCRYQRALSPLPLIAELECGVWHGFHTHVGALTPNHYRLLACAALLAGIQGWNWYMLAGRDNWYYSPLNERGVLREELAGVFMDLHRVVRECDPPALVKHAAACALLEPLHIATDNVLADNPVLAALHAADADYEICDPELGRIERALMFYATADWLARSAQQRLAEYIERGGTLVLAQRYPQRDEDFRPHNGLGVVPPDRVLSPLGKQVALALDGAVAEAAGPVWCWDRPPGEPLVAAQIAGTQQAVECADAWMRNYIGKRWVCGYRQPRGAGALVVLGLPLSASLVRALHRWLRLPLYAQAELPGVHTALFERDRTLFLVATNLNDADVQTRIGLDGVELPPRVTVTDLFTGGVHEADRDRVVVGLPRRSGGVWRITPAGPAGA